jgi:hypothetical protein
MTLLSGLVPEDWRKPEVAEALLRRVYPGGTRAGHLNPSESALESAAGSAQAEADRLYARTLKTRPGATRPARWWNGEIGLFRSARWTPPGLRPVVQRVRRSSEPAACSSPEQIRSPTQCQFAALNASGTKTLNP